MVSSKKEILLELLQQTNRIVDLLDKIDTNMDNNEPEQVEQLNEFLSQRSDVMTKWDSLKETNVISIDAQERKIVKAIKQLDEKIQPKIEQLFHSFSQQMKKYQHGKQSAQKFQSGYGENTTNSSFIDKRK